MLKDIFQHYLNKRLRYSVNAEGYTLTSADRLKCIFIHIPKCAGVSICHALFGNLGGGHLRAVDYRKIYSPQEYAEFFKFAFVRNPWDRLASAFFFLKSGGITGEDRQFAKKHLAKYDTFGEFVTEWVTPRNIMTYYHFKPQSYYLCVKNQLPQLDFIGYYENIQEDFRYVCDKLGVKADLAMLNKTKMERGDYRTLYTERMKQIVAEVYADDIALLGYTFDNSNINSL